MMKLNLATLKRLTIINLLLLALSIVITINLLVTGGKPVSSTGAAFSQEQTTVSPG